MEIVYKDILLLPWKSDFAPGLAEIANNEKISDNLRDGLPFPYTVQDAHSWLDSIMPRNDPPQFFAIFYSGTLTGSIGLVLKDNVYRKNIEMGYFLDEHYWGKGIITKAILAVSSYAFTTFDILRIYAEVYSDNTGSRRALEKSGFSCEAVLKKSIIKKGEIKDSCIYSVLKENFRIEDIEIRE
ncbi:MAG TPA: GNAT family N-acetyltransferase [Bacteroidales bacterium]|nr:GNAT family N-acetyltransferase [Bacteroidales bacterium]